MFDLWRYKNIILIAGKTLVSLMYYKSNQFFIYSDSRYLIWPWILLKPTVKNPTG